MDAGEDTQKLSKGFVVGTLAFWLGKRAEDNKSHEWTVHVRSANGDEDAGLWIKRVVFQLHPTLQPPTRVIDSPPFEVTEQGWGEFEIHMQIFVHDCNEKPIEVSHILKLYPDGDTSQQLNPTKPVVSERYDEIVFNDPPEALRARLETIPSTPSPNGWRNHPNAKWFTIFDMEAEFSQLQQVYQMVTAELQSASKRRTQQEEELKALRNQMQYH
mmetsp:Transcript_8813/g.17778  ORF Transcript_8813/g.17778 Transcript_8813/m.17778 type:complete len:215 (-) Transcript_8813:112-756(-)